MLLKGSRGEVLGVLKVERGWLNENCQRNAARGAGPSGLLDRALAESDLQNR
jgi:hypothetical protein